jgi:hypothetical protein
MPIGKNVRDFNQAGFLALVLEVCPIYGIKCTALKFFKVSTIPAVRKCPKTLKAAKLLINEDHLEFSKCLNSCTVLGIEWS